MSDSLRLHGMQHTRLPWPLLSAGVCLNSCTLSQWCHPTISSSVTPFSSCPQSFPVIRVFSGESALCIRLPNYCSFSISPSNEYSELISFRIAWFDLCAVQWTLRGLLQHHSLKDSVLQCSAFFMVHLSHLYVTTGKTIALTIQTSVDKVMPLLCNLLCRFVIAFLPRNKCLLILCLQSPSAVIWGSKKIKSITISWIAIKYAVVF